MAIPLRVLFIEDSEDDARLIEGQLVRGGYAVQSQRVAAAPGLAAALAESEWDVIIADYSLPRFNVAQALRLLQESGRDLPFIIVSGTTASWHSTRTSSGSSSSASVCGMNP